MVTRLDGADSVARHQAAQARAKQEMLDANVRMFTRSVQSMASSNGIRVKAEATLGGSPSVRISVGTSEDAKAVRELFNDKELLKMEGLSGGLEGEGDTLKYREPSGYLSEGVPIQIEIGAVPNPRPAVIESPPRGYGFDNNVDANGAPRVATTEEFMEANVLALGRAVNSRASNNGIRAHIAKSGPTSLQVSVDSDEKKSLLKSLLLEKDFWKLHGFSNASAEEVAPGQVRFKDSGYLHNGVIIELVVAPPTRSVY